ncbi:MAG: DNA mismatch repair protein MutS [Firmicutes bacterium]|nr:DNA mismatch repair protein MutS [Bacillota bacterium]
MAKLTPMMDQYFKIKNEYKDCILFYRLGDFYEMFYEDAITASSELELTLTSRANGTVDKAPMCGVPFHSSDSYVSRLVERGYKVAICEQIEDPKLAKGIVKREVIRVVTPGTVIDPSALDSTKNNYLMCIYKNKNGYGMAVCDVTTGEFSTTQFVSANAFSNIIDEIERFRPSEIICNEMLSEDGESEKIYQRFNIRPAVCDKWMFDYIDADEALKKLFEVQSLEGFGLKNKEHCVCASGALMEYILENQKTDLNHINTIKYIDTSEIMALDIISRKNLELTENLREKNKKGSLLWVLDKTRTSMGARLLRKWINEPLKNPSAINLRLDAVEEFFNDVFLSEEVKEVLNTIQDLERITSKMVYKTANAKDLAALKDSIENLPLLKKALQVCKSAYVTAILGEFDTLDDICRLISASIVDEPPFSVREGGMIRAGYNSEFDLLYNAKSQGKKWLSDLEEKERELTGIKNLKVRYNKVFGYYIEVTKSNLADVPERYIRKQTLSNCERYMTEELNNLAEIILSSEEKAVSMEYDIFCEIRDSVLKETNRIKYTAYLIAVIDVLVNLAEAARKNNYVKPVVDDSEVIEIHDGRHPVVERMLSGSFIPNDTILDTEENRLAIITGPNMAGKSTYMRQVALITVMAQMGSFVPAKSARIGVVDRIFTRIGASDDIGAGQSTFMTEMVEVANILNNATEKSLLVLDEIGRGTSTFDGLSIAWAVLEYVDDKKKIGARALFATHYHELTELEGKLEGVKNYCITVEEDGEDIIFLRKIVRGGAQHSYGIQVARLAGLPRKVITRSKQILKKLDAADINRKTRKLAEDSKSNAEDAQQMDIFTAKETLLSEELQKIDVMSLTPIEAIQILFELQKKSKGM